MDVLCPLGISSIAIQERLEASRLLLNAPKDFVSVDRILEVGLETWENDQRENHQKFEGVFVAADTNGDGVLSFKEFVSLVANIDPTISRARLRKLFKEVTAHCSAHDDRIMPSHFANVLRANGIHVLSADGGFEGDTPPRSKKHGKTTSRGFLEEKQSQRT